VENTATAQLLSDISALARAQVENGDLRVGTEIGSEREGRDEERRGKEEEEMRRVIWQSRSAKERARGRWGKRWGERERERDGRSVEKRERDLKEGLSVYLGTLLNEPLSCGAPKARGGARNNRAYGRTLHDSKVRRRLKDGIGGEGIFKAIEASLLFLPSPALELAR